MKTSQAIAKIISDNNGYLFTSDAVQNGISRQSVIEYVNANGLEKVAHGIYITQETWDDPLFILQNRNPNIVFSHEYALQLHGLTEKEPDTLVVSVPRGYNATHLKQQDVKVHTVVKDYFDIGITQAKTFYGNTVRVYDRERTICDIIRNKDNMDIQVFSYAIKQYMRSRDKNLPRLSEYGRIFKISDKIHIYTEVML